MRFLEKDLETIIWENYAACEERGLQIEYSKYFQYGLKFRQLNLSPFGVADLVNIYYYPYSRKCMLQVIECKQQQINGATYLQAKRYGTALMDLLFLIETDVAFEITYVLIGSELNTDGDIAHVVSQDKSCRSFTYAYAVDGIRFTDVSRHWGYGTSSIGAERQVAPRLDVSEHIRGGQRWMEEKNLADGDFSSPLLVTPNGVLLNTWLTDYDTYGPAN